MPNKAFQRLHWLYNLLHIQHQKILFVHLLILSCVACPGGFIMSAAFISATGRPNKRHISCCCVIIYEKKNGNQRFRRWLVGGQRTTTQPSWKKSTNMQWPLMDSCRVLKGRRCRIWMRSKVFSCQNITGSISYLIMAGSHIKAPVMGHVCISSSWE